MIDVRECQQSWNFCVSQIIFFENDMFQNVSINLLYPLKHLHIKMEKGSGLVTMLEVLEITQNLLEFIWTH